MTQSAGGVEDHLVPDHRPRRALHLYHAPMSSLPEIEPRFGVDGHSFEECEHIVHDHDPDTALCGVDQTNVPWNQGFTPCQACMAVAQGRMS